MRNGLADDAVCIFQSTHFIQSIFHQLLCRVLQTELSDIQEVEVFHSAIPVNSPNHRAIGLELDQQVYYTGYKFLLLVYANKNLYQAQRLDDFSQYAQEEYLQCGASH